jgi:hypothetical protein
LLCRCSACERNAANHELVRKGLAFQPFLRLNLKLRTASRTVGYCAVETVRAHKAGWNAVQADGRFPDRVAADSAAVAAEFEGDTAFSDRVRLHYDSARGQFDSIS